MLVCVPMLSDCIWQIRVPLVCSTSLLNELLFAEGEILFRFYFWAFQSRPYYDFLGSRTTMTVEVAPHVWCSVVSSQGSCIVCCFLPKISEVVRSWDVISIISVIWTGIVWLLVGRTNALLVANALILWIK